MSTVSDFPSTRPGGWDDPGAAPLPAPLRLYEATVGPQWVDYNGHMSEWCYLLVMGDSSDAFFRYIGIDDAYRAAGQSLYTVETHIRNLDELAGGDRIALTLRVLDADPKRVHLLHEVLAVDPDGGERIVATGEQMLLHVDASAGRTAPLPPTLLERVRALRDAHAVLPRPDYVGRPMGLRRREG
jgi:acyl-CoA thioester hydrolase